jgi:membrane associated rhomboid family serine protease
MYWNYTNIFKYVLVILWPSWLMTNVFWYVFVILIHPETIEVVPHTFKDKNDRFTRKRMNKIVRIFIDFWRTFMHQIFVGFCRLTKMGALKWDDVVNHHQGWRLVTCIWLHAGIIHLAANMLSLVFIGIRLEQQFGFGMSLFLSSVHWISINITVSVFEFCVIKVYD